MGQNSTRGETILYEYHQGYLRTPKDIHLLKDDAFRTEQKEVLLCVLLVASEAEARKPVTIISEAGYYLCPQLMLWQSLGLLSEAAACFLLKSLVLIWTSITWLNGSAW